MKRPKSIYLRKQPEHSNICGQCCLAMVTRKRLGRITDGYYLGFRATRTKDLVLVLRQCGIACPDRLVRISAKNPLPDYAIVKMRYAASNQSHWVVKWGGWMYDPAYGRYPPGHHPRHSRRTSFLPLTYAD